MNVYLQYTIRFIAMLAITLPLMAQAGTTLQGGVCGSVTDCVAGLECVTGRCNCTTDADGDGTVSAACGGDDCDDNDAGRYPGSAEICDGRNVDEDCNDSTSGNRDNDGDGQQDWNC
ncbi:MAG: MopE-related protein [Gammaproteobacteria bacterium]|nr:MopE-related protein [Gammaproteobacteria bacterium]